MGQEIVKEIEVVQEEKEETITYCDNCGATEEEKTIVPVGINPQVVKEYEQEWSVIQVYEEEHEARMEAEKAMHGANYSDIPSARDNLGEYNPGVGTRKKTNVEDAYVSAKTDMCVGCIETHFDINIPEDEEVSDIEFDDGGIAINTTKEVTTIWPQIDIPEWAEGYEVGVNPFWGWKGKIVFWPIIPAFILFDALFTNSNKWGEIAKGYYAASLGAMLWATVLFLIATMILGVSIVL